MSLELAVLLIATLSTTIVSLLSCLKRPAGRFWFLLAALVIPFTITNLIYWFPVENGADESEYWQWAPLFIIPCTIAGAIPSVAAVLFIRRSTPIPQIPLSPK